MHLGLAPVSPGHFELSELEMGIHVIRGDGQRLPIPRLGLLDAAGIVTDLPDQIVVVGRRVADDHYLIGEIR